MIYIRREVKQRLKLFATIFGIAIAIAIVIFSVLKYQVEGEGKVPFEVKKIIVISSATTRTNEGKDNVETENNANDEDKSKQENEQQQDEATQEDQNYIWNEKVVQTNDVYIYLDKNNDYKGEQTIKNVKIDNIRILENVKVGKIQVYMPNSLDDGLYKYINDYLVTTTLTYKGAGADNKKALEINNQGGCIYISFANMGLDNYKSNDELELPQGGTILEKIGLKEEDLKFKVMFDLIIEVQDKTYKTDVTLELPVDGVVGKKESYVTIDNFENTVYKRLK